MGLATILGLISLIGVLVGLITSRIIKKKTAVELKYLRQKVVTLKEVRYKFKLAKEKLAKKVDSLETLVNDLEGELAITKLEVISLTTDLEVCQPKVEKAEKLIRKLKTMLTRGDTTTVILEVLTKTWK